MNAHFSAPDPRRLLGENATRLRASFLKALAVLKYSGIADYAGVSRLARAVKNGTLKHVQLPFLSQ
jgi:hypothetical protein